MKKALSLVLVAMMLLSLMPVAIANSEVPTSVGYTDTGANLLIGGDFNNAQFGVGNFIKDYEAAKLEYVADGGVDGSGCVALYPSATNGNVCMRYVTAGSWEMPLIAGHQYVISFKVKNPSTNTGSWDWSNMQIRDGAVAGIFVHTGGVSKDAWHSATSDVFTYDGNGSNLRIYCSYANVTGDDKIYIDDVSLVDVTPVSGNLVCFGDFESAIVYNAAEKWHYDEGTSSLVSGVGVDGSDCLALNLNPTGKNNAILTWVDVIPKKTYILSCDVKVAAGSVNWVTMDAEADGLQVWDNAFLRPMNKVVPNDWMTITSFITIPEGVTRVPVRILAPAADTATGTDQMLIDNISVRCADASVQSPYAETYNEDLKGVNLLYNGDCSRNEYSWDHCWPGASFVWDATAGVNNSGAWVATSNDPKNEVEAEGCLMAVQAGQGKQTEAYRLYEFSVDVWRSADCDANTRLEIKLADETFLGWASFATKTGEWETLTYKYWSGSEPKNLAAMVVTDNNYTTGTVKVDNFAMRELGVAERFDIVDMESAVITDISNNVATVELTFGAQMWIGGNVLLCDSVATSGCNKDNPAQYQYSAATLTAVDGDVQNEKTYASKWIATFNLCGHEYHADLWTNGIPANCVVRITDWLGEELTQNGTLDERMVVAANVAEGINGERIAAQYIDAGMDAAWVATTVKKVATIGDKVYFSFDEAMANATAGDTVTMYEDKTISGFFSVGADVTVDLNGHNLTTDNLFSFGDVVDATNGQGGLYVSNDRKQAFVQLQEDNAAMPLYDSAAGCYRFFDYDVQAKVTASTKDSVKLAMHVELPNAEAYALLKDAANKDMIKIHLLISKADGTSQSMDYFFMDSTVAKYADESAANLSKDKAFLLTISGLSAINATVTANANVSSVTGVAGNAAIQ